MLYDCVVRLESGPNSRGTYAAVGKRGLCVCVRACVCVSLTAYHRVAVCHHLTASTASCGHTEGLLRA